LAEINYTPITPGDAVTASSLNTPFQAGVAGINALETYALRPGALRSQHLPSVANILGTVAIGENFQAPTAYTKKWDQINKDDLTNWDIVVDAAGNQLSLTWTAFKLGMTDVDKYAAILVLANVHFYASSSSGATRISDAVISVQFRQPAAGATWWTHSRATRLCSQRVQNAAAPGLAEKTYQDIPLRVLITRTDLATYGGGSTHAVDGVRLVVCGNTAAVSPAVQLREGRLTALRLRSGGLPT